jgi:hypothetical protein
MMLANKTVTRGAVAARSPQLPAVRPRSLVVRRFKVITVLRCAWLQQEHAYTVAGHCLLCM